MDNLVIRRNARMAPSLFILLSAVKIMSRSAQLRGPLGSLSRGHLFDSTVAQLHQEVEGELSAALWRRFESTHLNYLSVERLIMLIRPLCQDWPPYIHNC